MTDSDRKKVGRRSKRASRGGARQSGSAAASQQNAEDAKEPARGNGNPQLTDSDEVSSLLARTSKEVKELLEAADEAAEKIREAAHKGARGPSNEASGEGDMSSLIAKTGNEVQQVLEAADEAADKIREEAREEARRYLEQARRRAEAVTGEHMDRVTTMSERVLDELSAVHRQLSSLQTAFDQAIKTMSADLGVEQTIWEGQDNGEPAETESDSASLRRRLRRRRPRKHVALEQPQGISEGARLLALQQMMSGVDAEVIEARLKKEFGIEDPRPILDWMGMQQQRQQG